jgi:mycothiol synthase
MATAAWQPDPPLAAGTPIPTAFAERLGYRHDRWFWLMRRERGAAPPEPVWPAGVTVRVFDGSDAMLADYAAAYNDSFAAHYRFMPTSLAQLLAVTRKPAFRPDGVLLAYRDGRPAGFCRTELFAARGEIGTLGTAHAARGIGLGRALLRWGVGWLERESPHPITLLVDGENESALALYRSRASRSGARAGSGAAGAP